MYIVTFKWLYIKIADDGKEDDDFILTSPPSDKDAVVLDTHRGCEVDASFVLLLKADVWWLFVQSDAKSLQLMFNQLLVAKRFQHIEHNQDQVASSSHWKRKAAAAAGTGCK